MSGANVETWSSGALLKVARGQRRIILLLLINISVGITFGLLLLIGDRELFSLVPYIGLGLGIIQLSNVWRLADALRSSVPWLYSLLGFALSFVPFLLLLLLLFLNQNATKVLRANGIRVGFLGADLASFGTVSFGPDECSLCGKYLKHADQVMECRKCDINVCESCADRTRESAGMIESFTLNCPKCKNKLSEVRGQAAVIEEPAAEDFGDE